MTTDIQSKALANSETPTSAFSHEMAEVLAQTWNEALEKCARDHPDMPLGEVWRGSHFGLAAFAALAMSAHPSPSDVYEHFVETVRHMLEAIKGEDEEQPEDKDADLATLH